MHVSQVCLTGERSAWKRFGCGTSTKQPAGSSDGWIPVCAGARRTHVARRACTNPRLGNRAETMDAMIRRTPVEPKATQCVPKAS